MCVAFFTLAHPDYALVLCSNRDEHLSRPTQPAHFHPFGDDQPDVLSGIDLQAGGTWLGLSRTGKLALLTNITEDAPTFASSRGHLVSAFVASPPSPSLDADAQRCVPPDARYAGFNLLVLAPTSHAPPVAFDARYVTNHGAGGRVTHRPLTPERHHGLSNGIDGQGADAWPKVQHGLDAFQRLLDTLPPNTSEEELAERLFDLLTWRSAQPPRDRSELRHTIQVDPLHIGNTFYGTRLSTVVLVRQSGHVVFIERDRWTLDASGGPVLADPGSQRVFRFGLAFKEQPSSM